MIQGIAIVGGNGSGKTTLGKALAENLGWMHMDAENYWFEEASIPYSAPRTKEKVCELILADIQKYRKFILSSVNCDFTFEINRHYCCVIYLQVPLETRLVRIKQRAVVKFGSRVLEGGDMYEQEQAFFQFVASRTLGKNDLWVHTLTCPVLYLDGTLPISANIETILLFLKDHTR